MGPRRDIQDSVSPMMSQHEEHMTGHESPEEVEVHSMHDDPFWESQLEVHMEPMMVEDEQLPLGSTIDEEKIDVQTARKVIVFANTCPWEMLVIDRVVL